MRTVTVVALLALALPAAAECGPATYTNDTGTDRAVAVQLGEGYEEVVVAAGDTVEYWESAPGRSWAVWDLASGDVIAQGVQCGEPVVVENPVVDTDAVVVPVLPIVDDSDLVVPARNLDLVTPNASFAPHLPAGVWAQ